MEGRANKAGLKGSHGLLYKILESLGILFKKLQQAGKFAEDYPEEVSTYFSCAINTARTKLEEYYGLTDVMLVYWCAVTLYPANKFTYFELEWSYEKKWITKVKRVVQDVYAQYKEAAIEVDIAKLM